MANNASSLLEALPLAALRVKMGLTPEVKQERDSAEWQRCRDDICYWVDTYVWTFDPRPEANPNHLPFKLYDFQRDYINWLESRYRAGENGLVEKSRDMGATWGGLAWLVHHWLFDDTFQALLGSRKEDLVDNSQTMDGLINRMAYIVDKLPDWMRPAGYDNRKHRQYLKVINPESGNALVGESANPNFARQGRYSVIWLDEFAFWEWGEAVLTGTADATSTSIVVSTPNGGNHFKRLRFSGRVPVYTLHWRVHPKKTQAWYEKQQSTRTDENIAQELDISYDKSVRGRVYPEWDHIKQGTFAFVQGWPLYVSWDFGLDDHTTLIWWQRNPRNGMWRIVDSYSNNARTIDFYTAFCTGQLPSGLPYQYSQSDIAKVESHAGWGAAVHFGDPAGKQRNQVTGTSVIDEMRKAGIYVQSRADVNEFEQRWQKTKLFLRKVEGVNQDLCLTLHDAMVNARFPERRETSQATNAVTKPIHDWTSHFRTAVEYMAVNEPLPQGQRPTIVAGTFKMGG